MIITVSNVRPLPEDSRFSHVTLCRVATSLWERQIAQAFAFLPSVKHICVVKCEFVKFKIFSSSVFIKVDDKWDEGVG
jgi:hypothetical protein